MLELGVFELTSDGRAPLSPSARGEGGSMTMKFTQKTSGERNTTESFAIDARQESATTQGGEMPEIPTAK